MKKNRAREPLTLDQAFDLLEEIWGWVVEQGGTRDKKEWPGWAKNGGSLPYFMNNCPACEYSVSNKGSCNEACIIRWGGGSCMSDGSEYNEWHRRRDEVSASQVLLAIRRSREEWKSGKRREGKNR